MAEQWSLFAKLHGGNVKSCKCAVDRAGTASTCCRSRNTVFNRAVQMSTEGQRDFDALGEAKT